MGVHTIAVGNFSGQQFEEYKKHLLVHEIHIIYCITTTGACSC